LGLGPFEVVRVVDRSDDGIPPGAVLRTDRGEREINTVWLESLTASESLQD
jgi:hypothetical protein